MKIRLDHTLFEQPSSNIRGIATAFVECELGKKTKSTRVGHCYLFTDAEPKISLDIPKNGTVDELGIIAQALIQFADKVRELDALRQQ